MKVGPFAAHFSQRTGCIRCVGARFSLKVFTLIEIFWGKPLSFVVSPEGDVQVFSTAEQVQYWLRKKWPISDEARDQALQHVEAAMDCLMPVGTARRAFITAARSAGFVPENLVSQPMRGAAA